MDIQITRNDIIESKANRLSVGYCDLQDALQFYNRIGYSAGVYGWNYDYYSIGNVAVITGYRPEGKHVDYDEVEKVNAKGKELRDSWDWKNEDYLDLCLRARKVLTPMIEALNK